MSFEVLDPTHDETVAGFEPARRLGSLHGVTVGIVSNAKHGTRPFFDEVERELRTRHGVGRVVRVEKGNYSAPAGDEIMDRARDWHALIAGVGD